MMNTINTFPDADRYLTRLLIVRGFMVTAFSLLLMYTMQRSSPGLASYYPSTVMLLLWLVLSLPLLIPRRSRVMPSGLLMRHILIDITLLTALLYDLGGYTNPLISLYLFPVLIAGLTSSRRNAWICSGLVVLAYSWLTQHFVPLPMMHSGMQHGFQMHLVGMWLTFVISVLLLVSVVIRMSEQRREQAQQLADLQQRSMREHTMVALGAQAASDAHEMGTPINTLLLLLEDVREEPSQESLDAMQQQLDHCREILNRLGSRARALSRRCPERIAVAPWLAHTVLQWRNLHPNVVVQLHAVDEELTIMADPMLEQVLFILLDNALEADADRLDVQAVAKHGMITVTLSDNGTGFPVQLLELLGREPVSTKSDSKGMGLYLARFAMDQVKGTLVFRNQATGGASVSFRMPQHRGE